MPIWPDVWPFLIPVGVAFYLFWLSWARAGDPQPDSVMVQYEPPENLTPGECGALLDDAVAMRAISATIVDLSVKGYLAIEWNDGKLAGPEDKQKYVFHLIKLPSAWSNLKAHERALLSAIFIPTNPLRMLTEGVSRLQGAATNPAVRSAFSGVQAMITENPSLRALSETEAAARPAVGLLEVQTHFNLHLAEIRNSIFESLVAGGYYARRPDQIRMLYVAKGLLLGLLMVFVGGYLVFTGTPRNALILSAILTATVISGFGFCMPARSVTGMRALAKVLGFADFLRRVEKDHIARLETTPQLFEKYLPYAMALGIEKPWAQSFARVAVAAPQWYRGSGSEFFPTHLVDDMSNMILNKQES